MPAKVPAFFPLYELYRLSNCICEWNLSFIMKRITPFSFYCRGFFVMLAEVLLFRQDMCGMDMSSEKSSQERVNPEKTFYVGAKQLNAWIFHCYSSTL
ncbi:hypothetical protein [Endozoicomonas sp. SCSIO W0465]|uniref:hypothetical protein n=1 Tax=Endozoicomonas sp. SCSIO W0465 TaxID=2918516 RepID=UPI002075F8B9|nr:hypothetical protein [Endozoicomonas sp. SCSIO W0465]USE37793.1 hypothetical protein MJO57_06265 [Endozoicomonas sp. SCSIO W0465]